MAENQDISQVNSEDVNTAPTETVSTGTDGSQVVDVAPKPRYRKKVYDVLKTQIYVNNPDNFKLTEQQFYKKIDSDQEYAKKVYGVLKSANLPASQFSLDENQFLTKLYEKDIKKTEIKLTDLLPGGTSKYIDWTADRVKAAKDAIQKAGGTTEFKVEGAGKGAGSIVTVYIDKNGNVQSGFKKVNQKAIAPKTSSQVDLNIKVKRALIYREEKKTNPNAVAPELTDIEMSAVRQSDEYKIAKELEDFQANVSVGDGMRFDITESLKNSFVIKDWDKLYNEYQDIVDNYGLEEESVVNTPKVKDLSTTYGFSESKTKGFSIPGINPVTGQSEFISSSYASINKSILERNAIRQQYKKKIEDVNNFFNDAVDNGINQFNYNDYLTKNLSGATVASNTLIRNLAKRIIATYKGKELGGFVEDVLIQAKSDQALEDILIPKLKVKIETFEKAKKSKEAADSWVQKQGVDFNTDFTSKQQEFYNQGVKEVEAYNASLIEKRDAEIATVTAPYIEQGKAINENLEKLTNDYKASVTLDKAAAEVPEIRNLKFNYEITIKSLSNGQYTQEEANKIAKDAYDKYVQEVTPLYNQWQETKFKDYEAAFNSEKQKIVELTATAELEAGRIASRYDNQSKSFQKLKDEQYQSKLQSYITTLQNQGADQKLIDGYKKVYQETFQKLSDEENASRETNYRLSSNSMGPVLGPFGFGVVTNFINSFGDAIASSGYQLNSPALKYFGEIFSNSFSVPDMEIKSLKEIVTDPLKYGASVGQVLGRQAPMYLSVFVPVVGEEMMASKYLRLISNLSISGTIGFTSETVDMAGGMYRRVLNETGDPIKANLASWEVVNDNKKIWYTYALDGLPFLHDFKNVIKGTGLLPMAGRFFLRGGIEATTETLFQEFPQSASEDRIYYKYVRGANNITTYDMMFTNDKIIRDKYNNPLTDSRDGRGFYLTTGGLDRLKSTALNIAPSSFLMGGSGSVLDYARYKYSEQVGKNMFARNMLNDMSDSFHKQQIFQILLTRGKNTAAGYLVGLNRSGKLSSEELANLSASLEEMEGYSKMAQRQKWKPERTMAMAALNFEVANINTQLQNPELTQQEKDMLTKKLDYSKRNLDDFVQGKKADYVMMSIGNQLHILTYAQFDDVMADQNFVNNTKGTIKFKAFGSEINAQGENLNEKGMKVFDIKPPTQEQIDEFERNGPPVMDVFANTEIPHLNNLVNDLEGRMNNAEEIDEKDMNSAIAGLYQQLQDILDNHYNTENGKRAAQMLMDTIEKFEDYEFTTKEETVSTTERTTTQSIREVVNASKNIFGRITGTAKSGAKKFATIVTGFKQRGKYSVEINEKDEVVLTPMSGAPIILGNKNELNGKVKFVGSNFSGKTGKISTITFRVNEANENGVMPEVTLSTADGFTYDELLDIAIDLRAMEVGEVTTEEFDSVVEQVTTGKSYPNMGRSEQKQKAKAEAEAAAQQQAPQQTEEQINQEVQRLQAQQDEELRAAQDMTKSSNLAKNKMTLNEALKARDEKIKQIKSKYKVLIDNAKKGVTQETQQQEAEQQQQQQQNNDVVDITSDNIDELQNIETANKFQKRVLNAIPNMLKALGKIVPGIKVSIHLTTQSYRNSVVKDSKGTNDGRGTKGYYWKGTINLDLSNINSIDGVVTAFHEAFHGMYQVLDEDLQNILYKSIQTIIFRNGFRLFSIKTRSSFDKFAKQYKDHQQQEEAVVEFLGHMASGAVTLTVPGYKMFIEALNKILDKIGLGSFKFTTSNQAKDFARGVVNAMKTGQDIGELTAPLTKKQQGQQDISFRLQGSTEFVDKVASMLRDKSFSDKYVGFRHYFNITTDIETMIGTYGHYKEGLTQPESVLQELQNLIDSHIAEQAIKETPKDISFRKDTAKLFDQVNNLKEKVQEAENTTEKRKFASERRDILAENPSVKLIDDNFNSIVEQLKNNEEFEFKGPCF